MTTQKKNLSPVPYIALLGAVLLWSSSFVAMKIGLSHFDPNVLIFGRMLIGSICLIPLFGYLKRVQYKAGDWKPLCFMAFCEPFLYFVFESHALKYTSAAQAGMVTSLLPLFVGIAAIPFLKEKISRWMMTGFLLAVAGVIWLSLSGETTENAPAPVLGNILEALAMASATGYVIMLKRLSFRYSSNFLTAFQAVAGAAFFFPLLFLPTTVIPTHFPTEGVLSVLYLGSVVTLGGYGLHNYAVSQIPASQSTAFINLIPVFTVLLGWLVLGETFTGQQMIASGLVLAGIFLSQKKTRPASQAS